VNSKEVKRQELWPEAIWLKPGVNVGGMEVLLGVGDGATGEEVTVAVGNLVRVAEGVSEKVGVKLSDRASEWL